VSRRPFVAVVVAGALGTTGVSASGVAVPWLVLTTTGSAAQTGLVAFAEMAPYVLLQALSGPWVDRRGGRVVNGVLAPVAALALLAVVALAAANALAPPLLLALMAVTGAARGPAEIAVAALAPATARHGSISTERAAGLATSTNRLGYLVGPPLAGVLIGWADAVTAIAVAAGLLAVSATVVVVLVPARSARADGAPTTDEGASYLARLRTGYALLVRDRVLLTLAVLITGTNLLSAAEASLLLPVWASRSGTGGAGTVGLVLGAGGVGALAGNLLGTWLAPRMPRRAVVLGGFLLGGPPSVAVLALTDAPGVVAAVAAACGLVGGAINPVLGALQYERVPAHAIARVLAAVRATAWAGIPLGPLLAGLLVDTTGLLTAVWTCTAVYLVLTLTPFAVRGLADMDRRPDVAAGATSPAHHGP